MTEHQRPRSRDLFPTDGPVRADRLIGRAADVDELANALDNGLNRILVGPRRTGKTSVARAAVAEVRARGSYTVEVDLFALGSAAEFAEALVRALVANRPAPQRAGAAARRAGRSLAETTSRVLSAKMTADLGDEVAIAFTTGLAARDPERYLSYAFELLQTVATLDGKQVVLFIDEFQEVAASRAPFGNPDSLTKRMRSILQRSDSVTSIFAGSIEHTMRDLFTPSHRAFYKFGSFDPLTPITREEWLEGITARLAQDDTSIGALALKELVQLGAGHPRVTMLLAQQAHSLAVLTGVRHIDDELVAEAYVEAMVADSMSHLTEVERIRELGRHSFDVCRRIARGQAPYAGKASNAAYRAVEALERAGFLERSPGAAAHTAGSWHMTDPLLAAYLAALG